MDALDKLHKLTLSLDNAETGVTVNQRALIDKVLSRYSSDNTLLRELLQNSDDANATVVQITYQSSTLSPRPNDLNKTLCKRVVVRNNGQIFRKEDWTRLSRIAEGNPDESKIGAFGVGFYSVFSICEDPFITSGDSAMAFYWKNDQLFVRSARLPCRDEWTTFSLNMRLESEIPTLLTLTKFLATSLTFSRSVSKIEILLDDLNLCTLVRTASPAQSCAIPRGLQTITSKKIFSITDLESTAVQITATYVNATQSSPQSDQTFRSKFLTFLSGPTSVAVVDPLAISTSTMFLRILTSGLQSRLSPSFAQEFQRATKKPAPKRTKVQIVVVNHAEYAASSTQASIFASLMTFPNQGRVYIGFPTHQTTGFSGHISAPSLVPTVERESIDLVDRYIKLWNFEVLSAIGLLSRMAYHSEFEHVSSPAEAIHVMKFFTMSPATPQNVNEAVEESFFGSGSSFPVFSTIGLTASDKTRLPDPKIKFLKNTPILPKLVAQGAPEFIEKLKSCGTIECISIGDIKHDLSNRTLDETGARMFLEYCASVAQDLDSPALTSLLSAGLLQVNGGTINAGDIRFFADAKTIPQGVPLPATCLPSGLSSCLSREILGRLGWSELGVIDCLNYVCNTASIDGKLRDWDINKNPEFGITILGMVSKAFDGNGLSENERKSVIKMLAERTCIPTKAHGMRYPTETYFHTIKLFADLPMIEPMKGVREKFLVALGVRKTVELQVIFDRLVNGGVWTSFDLIRYLATVKNDIPEKDLDRLKLTAIANAEGQTSKKKVSELYEPNQMFRSLGLEVIDWPKDKWKPLSDEGSLLFALGLRKYPSPIALIRIMGTTTDLDIRERALSYFVINYKAYGYATLYNPSIVECPFLPTQSGTLEKPSNCFTNPAVAMFGFSILRADLVDKAALFGVKSDPPMDILAANLMSKPPQSIDRAQEQFGYMSTQLSIIPRKLREKLGFAFIIPIAKNGVLVRMQCPKNCFFDSTEAWFSEIFDMVDFGTYGNAFLEFCGCREKPTVPQIASLMVKDAQNVLSMCKSEERYLALLRQIAGSMDQLRSDKQLLTSMLNSQFLIATRYRSSPKASFGDVCLLDGDDEDVEGISEVSLQKAADTIIVDDVISYRLFRSDVYAVPEESELELLYAELGAPRLSTTVYQKHTFGGLGISNDPAERLKALILERISLFLHETNARTRYDIKWLTEHLKITMQESITLRRTLKTTTTNLTKSTATTACMVNSQVSRAELHVTRDWDLYDVAGVLCKTMLHQSKTPDTLLLEALLQNSLRKLRTRGYNVDRILQKREKDERERRILVKAQNERSVDYAKDQTQEETRIVASNLPLVPVTASQTGISKSLLPVPSISASGPSPKYRDLGDGNLHRANDSLLSQIKRNFGYGAPVSPHTNLTNSALTPDPIASSNAGQSVTSQQSINKTLESAIRATRSSDSSHIFSPPQTSQIQEARSAYCDHKPAQDLQLVATLIEGVKLFGNRDINFRDINVQYPTQIKGFAELLVQIARVYGCKANVMNIFYDAEGSSIAFNYQGSIYCNLRFVSVEMIAANDQILYRVTCLSKTFWRCYYLLVRHCRS